MAEPSQAISEQKRYNFLASTTSEDVVDSVDEIARLKKELDIIKNVASISNNPFRMAELAIEIQIERLRVVEISKARDAALQRLADVYVSVRQKNELIEQLQREKGGDGGGAGLLSGSQLSRALNSAEVDDLKAHISDLEKTIEDLRVIIRQSAGRPCMPVRSNDPPPSYEENPGKRSVEMGTQTEPEETPTIVDVNNYKPGDPDFKYMPPETDDPIELANARNLTLASIPLPPNPPDATLSAIVIPPPFTLHEFLNGAPATLRNASSLSNYRILHNVTTLWCPEREEHGYMYTPVYKCSTNPRIATAHRWAPMDVIGRMSKPTECFYNKEGVWYYAGSYKAFRLDNLSTKEWMQLPSETISAIIKETISGRKNSSPQNTYETSQLYAAGALKVACVGLQCVGFNQEVYKSIIDHSIKFSETKWKSLASASVSSPLTPQSTHASTAGTPSPGVKTPVVSRHMHRTPNYLGSGNSSAGSPCPSSHLGTPTGSLGLGSSLWNISNASASPVSIDAAAKKVFEGGENLATVEQAGKR
ncbi:hypothetical protein JR316_0002994 [Psilocybe cubensis]|uniref:Uncharacterized protein n=2 Tax=Psilocybe cubensis TaxID=181762 RepID=A0ACB8H6N6_PSICU|nr:hypothetical protein JR316_0002994 [Psilocybe cubensis]KAH9483526.1 hypothetical protein JR316_0002994 [Psilocybe cubensis]